MTDADEWWEGLSQKQQLEVWRHCWKPIITKGKSLPESDSSAAIEYVFQFRDNGLWKDGAFWSYRYLAVSHYNRMVEWMPSQTYRLITRIVTEKTLKQNKRDMPPAGQASSDC